MIDSECRIRGNEWIRTTLSHCICDAATFGATLYTTLFCGSNFGKLFKPELLFVINFTAKDQIYVHDVIRLIHEIDQIFGYTVVAVAY